VRASFHDVHEQYPVEIIVNPKMSFGTGHHETTYMMVQAMLDVRFDGCVVVDAGCGTGILSILAEKSGAKKVIALDTDPGAVENANENIIVNHCTRITVSEKTAVDIEKSPEPVNILLANITRNVLLDEIPVYSRLMVPGGTLILSGFFEDDIQMIGKRCADYGFELISRLNRNNWSALVFKKKTA
jgi:ribosomal protein L11 methyltransferase